MEANTFISGSIDLSSLLQVIKDQPARAIKGKTGKVYINLVISPRRSPDQYGNDVSILLSRTDEDKAAGATLYIGSGKTIISDANPTAATAADVNSLIDDLPF